MQDEGADGDSTNLVGRRRLESESEIFAFDESMSSRERAEQDEISTSRDASHLRCVTRPHLGVPTPPAWPSLMRRREALFDPLHQGSRLSYPRVPGLLLSLCTADW